MSGYTVVAVPQIDHGTRYVAISRADARAVRENPALLDYVKAHAILEVSPYGARTWAPGCSNLAARAAIREYLAEN